MMLQAATKKTHEWKGRLDRAVTAVHQNQSLRRAGAQSDLPLQSPQ